MSYLSKTPFSSGKKQRTILPGLLSMLLLLVVSASIPVEAQMVGGTLSGTVTDPTKAAVGNADVTIKNVATDVSRTIPSNVDGFFVAPNLLPGIYDITVTAPGFSTTTIAGVTVAVGTERLLNVTLNVGNVQETVNVSSQVPLLDLTTSSIGTVVGTTTVSQLPLNGRSWTDLALLQAGVNSIETQRTFNSAAGATGRGIRGFGAQTTISGARPQQNNYRLDGVNINDYANAGPGSILGGNLGVDAIQEFSILTTNAPAEYGRTSGGVINAITRSGADQFHGDAYEFLRNSALDARNYFDGPQIPPFRRNQFGFSGGGPIRKDRTFIFGDYEAVRQSKGLAQVDTVLSPAARAGILSTGTVNVDPSIQKFLALLPLPNGPLLNSGDVGLFSFPANQIISENFLDLRVDHTLSEKDSLSGTYVYDETPYSSPDNYNAVLIGNKSARHIFALEETHTFTPSMINTARLGFDRAVADLALPLSAINPLAKDPSLGAVPGQFAPAVLVPGLTSFRGGLGGTASDFFTWNSFQLYDDAFLTKGLHSLKFGIAVERMQLNFLAEDIPSGQFTFSSIANFLTNKPKRFDAPLPNLTSTRGLRQTLVGAYIQDDWRWRPSLTVNLGVRYEMTTVPTDVQGKLSNLLNLGDAQPHLGDPYFLNPTLRNFEPRIGFAWAPFQNNKTAVRGGFGIYDVLPLPYETMLTAYLASPFYGLGAARNAQQLQGTFSSGAFSLLGPQSLQATYVQHNPPRNYVMQWNLDVQHELIRNLQATIAYVGSHGVHQPYRADDIDIVLPKLTPQGYLWPSPVGSGTTINPNFGSIRALMWGGSSSYNALQTQITERMSHGLHLQGSFTWGKSIDTSSSTQAGDQFTNSISSLPFFDFRLSRGLSDFNIGRTLVISAVWELPGRKSASGLVGWAANGWQLGGIFTASDGVPFTPTFGTDGDPLGLNNSDPWDVVNRLSGPGCGTLTNPGNTTHYIKTECFAVPTAPNAAFYNANCDSSLGVFPQCFNLRGNAGRNILTAPGLTNLDFSMVKNNYIKRVSENFNVQFRAEIFNILNHPNFAPPVTPNSTDIFDSTGAANPSAGLLTSTSTTSREIQFALKVVW